VELMGQGWLPRAGLAIQKRTLGFGENRNMEGHEHVLIRELSQEARLHNWTHPLTSVLLSFMATESPKNEMDG
jgi:hypothetical protein